MRTRWAVALALGVLAGVIGTRIVRGPHGAQVCYRCEYDPARPNTLTVTAQFQHCATESLALSALLQTEAAPVAIDTALVSAEAVRVHRTETEQVVAGRMLAFRRYDVDLRERSTVDVSYRVEVGRREGEGHTHGFTGSTYGRATPEYVVSSYAQLLLVPTPIGGFHKVQFRYELPDGWSVASALDPHKLPRRFGDGTLNDYFFAPFIMGRFTRYEYKDVALRVVVAGGSQADGALADRVAMLYRSITRAFHATPTDPYLVILCPPDEEGFSTLVKPTFFGQVVTFANGHLLQPRAIIRRMVERLARSSGADVRFPEKSDRWFMPALYTWAADRALALTQPQVSTPLESSRYDDYVRMIFEVADVSLATADSTAAVVKGVATLDVLDQSIRTASGGADSLAQVLPGLSARDPGMRLRPFLERVFLRDLGDFFTNYVEGTTPLPFPALAHPRAGRGGSNEAVCDSIALVVAYDGNGFLETCGCKSSQWGGMARLATWSKKFRREFDGPVFMMSAGNAFPMNVATPVLDEFSREELALYLRLLAQCGCDVAAVGQSELYYGARVLSETAVHSPMPFVCANLERSTVAGVDPHRVIERQGVRLGVSGHVVPEEHPLYAALWEARTADLPRTPVLPATAEVVETMRGEGVGHLVIAGRIKPSVVRDVAATSMAQLVIVSCQPIGKCTNADGNLFVNDVSGFLGDDLVLYPQADRYGVSVFVLYRDAQGTIVDFSERTVYMKEDIPDDPATRREIDAFYATVGRSMGATAIAGSKLWTTEIAGGARYAGSEACMGCHEEQHNQWRDTAHAGAFKTLLKQHRQYNPTCVACHVTGFEAPTGYRFGDMKSSMASVQCESCHGPGVAHVASGGETAFAFAQTEDICRSCHTDDHSDMTEANYPDYLAKVTH